MKVVSIIGGYSNVGGDGQKLEVCTDNLYCELYDGRAAYLVLVKSPLYHFYL